MSYCKWWNREQDKCIHPKAPQNGDCDWFDESCPYDEQITENDDHVVKSTEIDIYPKCPHCQCELEMYEHYGEYQDDMLVQEQHFECHKCHRIFARTAVYKLIKTEWIPDEED